MQSLDARLYLLFTPALCSGDPWQTLVAALEGGVDAVQWRIKQAGDATSHRLLKDCQALCRSKGVPLLINDDVALAVEIGADGAHVGQDDMSCQEARALLGPSRLLGVSTHDPEQIAAAIEAGADHLGFGPCFATETKGYPEGQGPAALAHALAASRLPVFAIGGIRLENVGQLTAVGAQRIAVSKAILGAPDPGAAAASLRLALRALL